MQEVNKVVYIGTWWDTSGSFHGKHEEMQRRLRILVTSGTLTETDKHEEMQRRLCKKLVPGGTLLEVSVASMR